VVLSWSCRYVWRCPAQRIEEHYNKHATGNHLDVGVGTGYFLDRCRWPSPTPRIALLDVNTNTLEYASRRITRYKPEIYRHDILAPMPLDAPNFDSVGINYVLHCLPGSMESKAIVLDHLKALMNPNGVLFGSTLLHEGVSINWFARRLMNAYNRAGIFSNRQDNLDGLNRALARRLRDVTLEVVGCVALFSGRV
jgi:2-polyprenyl-3-methyl-5-hydroxy-6-metoxy-1,4-benzoquinol methylase